MSRKSKCPLGIPSKICGQSQENWNEDPTAGTHKELQVPKSIKKKAAESNTSANRLKNIST
jgi:hypothetical protein